MYVKVSKLTIITAVLGLLCSFCILHAYMQRCTEYSDGSTLESNNKSPVQPDTSCMAWTEIAEYVRNCVTDAIGSTEPGDLWDKLNNQISRCTANIGELIGVQFLSSKDGNKGFIDYVDNVGKNSCVLVTVGIRDDIEAERKLLKLVPNCRLFGADPILASGQVFNQIGKYFQLAVSGESNNQTATVLEDGGYKQTNLEHVGFVDFIRKLLNVTTVDFLYLGAEGAEYRILPLLTNVDLAGINVCQIATELHGPVGNYQLSMTDWEQIVSNLLTKSDFIPMWSETAFGHYRLYLINYKNPVCVRKFFRNWCYH